jgi:hypothetical protein
VDIQIEELIECSMSLSFSAGLHKVM